MKKLILTTLALGLGAAGAPRANAGDLEWAVVGKVLTGVTAAAAIAHIAAPAPPPPPVYQYNCCPAPPSPAAPAVVYVSPPPPPPVVVYQPPVIVVPAPVCVPTPVVSFQFGFGHAVYRSFHHHHW